MRTARRTEGERGGKEEQQQQQQQQEKEEEEEDEEENDRAGRRPDSFADFLRKRGEREHIRAHRCALRVRGGCTLVHTYSSVIRVYWCART